MVVRLGDSMHPLKNKAAILFLSQRLSFNSQEEVTSYKIIISLAPKTIYTDFQSSRNTP